MRLRDPHGSNLRSVSPIRTTSPGASLRSRVSRIPFTKVPFVEPMSSIQTPSRRGSNRACRVEAYSSAGQSDVVVRPAADRQRMRVEREGVALLEHGAREHDEPPELACRGLREEAGGGRLLRCEDHRLLRQAQVACSRAHDAPDEEVEKDEEADLQEDERRLDLRRRKRHYGVSRVKVISVEPIVKRVPSSSFTRFTRLPFTSTPFVESRSISQ